MDLIDRVAHRLKLRDLRLLEVVVRSKSMARAAAQLHLTQPAVSKTVSELEKTLGVRLLDRTRRGIEPTPQGHALLKSGIAMFDDLRQGVREIEFLSDGAVGEVRLAASDPMAGGFLPVIIDRLSRDYPRISVYMIQTAIGSLDHRSPQYAQLRERNVDLVLGPIIRPFAEDDLELELLFDDKLIVAASSFSPWSGRRKITLAELIDEPWGMPAPDSPVGARCVAAFRAFGLGAPQRKVLGPSTHLFKKLLATRRFLAMLPSSVLRFDTEGAAIKALPIDLPVPAMPIGIVTVKNRTISSAARYFIQAARDVAKSRMP